MNFELSNDEKTNILKQRLVDLAYQEYHINLSKDLDSSILNVDQSVIDSYNTELENISLKKAKIQELISQIS